LSDKISELFNLAIVHNKFAKLLVRVGRKTYGSFSKKDGRVASKKGDLASLNKFFLFGVYHEKDTFSIGFIDAGF